MISNYTIEDKSRITKYYVACGYSAAMEHFTLSSGQLKHICESYRDSAKKAWCSKYGKSDDDYYMMLAIKMYQPYEKRALKRYLSYFGSWGAEFKKLDKSIDTDIYKTPPKVPYKYKKMLVYGLALEEQKSQVLDCLPIRPSVLAAWRDTV